MASGAGYIPSRAKAEMGLALIKEAMLSHLSAHPEGLRNAEFAHHLGLESDHEGAQKDYLTYSVLGVLMNEGEVEKVKRGPNTFYVRKAK